MKKVSKEVKRISLVVIYLGIFLFTFYYFFLKSNTNFDLLHTSIFVEEMFTLSVSFWVLYEVTEIDIFNQGTIGKGLFFLFANFIVFSLRSIVVSLGNLNLPVFYELSQFFSRPGIFSLIRLLNTLLILIGLFYIAKVYRIKD